MVDSILIMIFTGMRVGEMLALTRFNVDIEKRIIIGGLKTEAGKNRMIPIHSKILPYVKKYYGQGGQALICKEDGNKISTDYYRRRLFYLTLEKLEIKSQGQYGPYPKVNGPYRLCLHRQQIYPY